MNNQIDGEFFVVSILESKYKKLMAVLLPGQDESTFFPGGWYTGFSNTQKIEILTEALEKNVLIVNTEEYSKNVEGVRGLR
jgi:hypothetical protein